MSMEVEAAAAAGKLNVVLFPWLAFGHMIPYLELAKRLAARGHAVTFLSTPRNIARLPPVPADLSPGVRLVALPATAVDGLPEGAESTADVPPEKNELIKKALDGLAAPFAAFLADAVAGGSSSRPDWIVIDFCHSWVPAIADAHKVPCAAGVLLQPVLDDADGDDDKSGARPEVLQWLDKQAPKSVIYVALGSEAPLTTKTLHELALGLELAGVRFLWAFRKPAGMSGDELGELLPAGFEDRTRRRGLVWAGWVPQVRVLAHAAVGAFLTHCGWGSTIEGLVYGHPLVMLPFVVDQGLIARAMAERGVGVEVARDESDGSFDRDGVAEAVRRVVVEEEGKVLASNAAKLKEVLGDQRRQDRYMDDLVGYLTRYKGESGFLTASIQDN